MVGLQYFMKHTLVVVQCLMKLQYNCERQSLTHIAQPSSTTSDLAAISVSCIADKLVYESGQMCTMQSHESGLMFPVHLVISCERSL